VLEVVRTRRLYSDEFKADVLELHRQVGINEAARRTGVDTKTIRRWHVAAGGTDLDRAEIASNVSRRNAAAAAAAHARVAKERAEARERVINRLARVSELALARELEVLIAGGFSREDVRALVDSRDKAIRALELLEGRATSRPERGFEQLIEGTLHALRETFAMLAAAGVAEALLEEARTHLATTLRELQDRDVLELEACDVDQSKAEAE
jgi:transposase-like protein